MKKTVLISLGVLLLSVFSIKAETVLKGLNVNHLAAPLGIDVSPVFGWEIDSDDRGCRQESYCISVKDADGVEVWNSGNVTSVQQFGIQYGGQDLQSRSAYTWTVSVTCCHGDVATASSTFETAFLRSDEWTAKWIGRKVEQSRAAMEIVFDEPVTCKYLKLDITKLGARASTDAGLSYAQFDEVEIYSGSENVARRATFSATNSWTIGNWHLGNVNDGKIGDRSALGWTTTVNPSLPVTLTAAFGAVQTVERIVLYPRQDDHATTGEQDAANFPASFTVQTSEDNRSYTTRYVASDVPAPTFAKNEYRVPYFGRNFNIEKEVKRARMYASALGVFTMKINGKPVTDAVLEPGESEYEKSVLYSTYDVTELLRNGKNVVIAQVAGGIYNIEKLAGRFSKGEVQNHGETALIAELLVEYTDGTTENIVTDNTWRTTKSPTLGSNWWGGEDYDARLQIEGIESAGYDVSGWDDVSIITPHFVSPHSGVSGFGVLKSRMYEPLRVVEEWKAVDVKTIRSGGHTLRMVDFGRNFAGQYRFKLKGKKGQQISLRCGESLNPDGSVFMQNYYTGPADTYEVYTFRGDEEGEEWGPEFMYHGFRYLQIIGLDEEPEAVSFTAMRIRSDMELVGNLKTGNALINDIHTICRDAIASQLYNSITDCPQREKLGWLDVPNEMYVSLNSNFNMQNMYKKVVMDCFDAQQQNGMVPSVSPFYMNVFVDDTNWGGAAILVPYRNWHYYGVKSMLAPYYNQMKRLVDHYTACTTNYIINNNFSVLSDWGQETAGVSPMVPTEFTETTTYYYLLKAMAEIAAELGHGADALQYQDLAAKVKSAFNARFYDSATGVYTSVNGGGGRQSEQAMPLYYGLVPNGEEAKVAAILAERVKADGYKIKTGEIALKPVFMSLAQYGYNDVVWKMANQTECPSYGYWVKQGYTTTPEYWDVRDFSQNHCMMDHIEEWFFTQLGGIQNAGMAFDKIVIRPYIPADLPSCDVATKCNYGTIRAAWVRTTGGYVFRFEVPYGTEAKIVVPVPEGQVLMEGGEELKEGANGVTRVTYGTKEAIVVVGGGDYEFTVGEGRMIHAADLEAFWLPVHSNDEIAVHDKIRMHTSDHGRYIGSSAALPVLSGNFVTGTLKMDEAVCFTVGQKTVKTLDGKETPLYTLQETLSELYLDRNTMDARMLAWNTTHSYNHGFDFRNGNAAYIYRNDGAAVSKSGHYLFFFDGGEYSGINAYASESNAQAWHVYKRSMVADEAHDRIRKAVSGQDRMYLERTFSKGWNTICLPFPMDAGQITSVLGEDAEVAAFKGTKNDSGNGITEVVFEKTDAIKANTPCLVYVPKEMTDVPAELTGTIQYQNTDLTISSADSEWEFVGSYDSSTSVITPHDYLLTSAGTLTKAGDDELLRPFRAFLRNRSGGISESELCITFIDGATGVKVLTADSESDGRMYDLQGKCWGERDSQAPHVPSGLYIMDGKKVRVR